jgi:NPCBM/NEW2 domain-containing protein
MSYGGPPSRGMLGHRSVAFWTVVAGIVAVISLLITLVRLGGSSNNGPSAATTPPAPAISSSRTPNASASATPSPTEAAVTTYLSDLQPVDGLPSTDPVEANGNTYAHTIDMYAQCDDPSATQNTDYILGRKYRILRGHVALADKSRAVTEYQVQLVGDGRILYTKRIRYGRTYTINVGIQRILRLSLRVTLLTGSDAQCFFQGDVIFGDLYAQS